MASIGPPPGTVAARDPEPALVTAARVMAVDGLEQKGSVAELLWLVSDDVEALESAVVYWTRRLRHRRSDDFDGHRALRLLRSALGEAQAPTY